MATTKPQEPKKSFFNCCSCGDEEKKKEVVVDLTEKRPDQSVLPVSMPIRPPSVYIQETHTKPRISFTYTSPGAVNNGVVVGRQTFGTAFKSPSTYTTATYTEKKITTSELITKPLTTTESQKKTN